MSRILNNYTKTKIKNLRWIFTLLLCLSGSAPLLAQVDSLADDLYLRREYSLSSLEYERILKNNPEYDSTREKLALSAMRQGEYRKAVEKLRKEKSFSGVYLRMYASMKSGLVYQSV